MTNVPRAVVCSSSSVVRLCVKVILTDVASEPHRVDVVAQVPGRAHLDCTSIMADRLDVLIVHDPGFADVPAPATAAAPVVAIVGDGEADGAVLSRLLRGGVSCITSIGADLEALPRACHLAVAGLGYLSPSLVVMLADHLSGANRQAHTRYHLTAREVQVLRLLADGHPPVTIAGMLRIKPRTVKYNLSSVYHKLGANGAGEAIALAYKLGLAS